MYDESKELTLRVHDECELLFLRVSFARYFGSPYLSLSLPSRVQAFFWCPSFLSPTYRLPPSSGSRLFYPLSSSFSLRSLFSLIAFTFSLPLSFRVSRSSLTYAIEECIRCAQRGGVGVVAYFRKEGRALGEVTK